MQTSDFRVVPGRKVNLEEIPCHADGGLDKKAAEKRFGERIRRLAELQELLYAEGKHSLLVVLQAMDAGGKDSTIRSVFGPINPQGCRVTSFKAPNDVERRHDFLWRIHEHTPRQGNIEVFNRSHYEDVLVVRVKNLVPESRWQARYEHINAFERMLVDEGTTIVKLFLHISKGYQKGRLERRLACEDKHWKFAPEDLAERKRWDAYRVAYEDALSRCSTDHAPWYVVPSERHWFRNLLVTEVLVEALERLDMKYPEVSFDVSKIRIQ
jgi:PPK2 family polyphosphate:nucleotide phosphotransferase